MRDGKAVSAKDLSPDEYQRLMTGETAADAGRAPTASDLMGGASKGLGVDELWEGRHSIFLLLRKQKKYTYL